MCGSPVLYGMPAGWDDHDKPVHQACIERELAMEVQHMTELGLLQKERTWLQ